MLIKIVTHYKLNKYNTIDNCIDTSAYYSILALARKELYYIADGNSKNKDVGIDNSKDKDISADNSKNKNTNTDNFKDKDVSVDNFKDKDISIDNSTGENNLDLNNNTNQEAIVSDQVPNNKNILAVSNIEHKGTRQTVNNIFISF